MKKFVLWALAVCMLISMSMGYTAAVADGALGDVYYRSPANWPTKHWQYMTADEIAKYEADGWERYTGVLWYDDEWKAMDCSDIVASDIQKLYNEGCTFHVIYSWVSTQPGKYGEQSVSVGRWILSPEQAMEYYKTYKKPVVPAVLEKAVVFYSSQFYYQNLACSEPDDTETEEILKDVRLVRHEFDTYEFGYGSVLQLMNGKYEEYTYSEALEKANEFMNEIPIWN